MKGTWKGFYQHESRAIPKVLREQKTIFDMHIHKMTNHHFYGTVVDDKNSGGMVGQGTIEGYVDGSNISFTKKMPFETILMPNGKLKTTKRTHKPIFYKGIIAKDGKSCSGTWQVKFGFTWVGILPLPVGTNKGIWEMTLIKA